MYAIMNGEGNLLNIRKFDTEEKPLWNSFKEKRFWFTTDLAQAQAQAILVLGKVVEIVEEIVEEPMKNTIVIGQYILSTTRGSNVVTISRPDGEAGGYMDWQVEKYLSMLWRDEL